MAIGNFFHVWRLRCNSDQTMRKKLTCLLLLFLAAISATAQDWSLGVSTGPFIFGDFFERTLRIGTPEGPGTPTTDVMSAATRAGLAVDIGHQFSERWSIRAEGTFTRAPLSIGASGEGFELEAGKMDIATFTLPLVFHINPRGSFRFHLHGGPAYALYHIDARENAQQQVPLFEGTRGRFGYAAGGGVSWHISDRFAIEAQLTDIVTQSPFRREDIGGGIGVVEIKRTQNVHTTIGLRWSF